MNKQGIDLQSSKKSDDQKSQWQSEKNEIQSNVQWDQKIQTSQKSQLNSEDDDTSMHHDSADQSKKILRQQYTKS